MIAFEKEDVISTLDLGDLSAIGFDGVSRIGNDAHSTQIHFRQVGCDSRFFVGVPRHCNLIHQPLSRGLKVHQSEPFFGFGLLQFLGGVHRGCCLGQGAILFEPRRCGIGVLITFPSK